MFRLLKQIFLLSHRKQLTEINVACESDILKDYTTHISSKSIKRFTF